MEDMDTYVHVVSDGLDSCALRFSQYVHQQHNYVISTYKHSAEVHSLTEEHNRLHPHHHH